MPSSIFDLRSRGSEPPASPSQASVEARSNEPAGTARTACDVDFQGRGVFRGQFGPLTAKNVDSIRAVLQSTTHLANRGFAALSAGINRPRKWAFARASRDITVPIGRSICSAMSR